MLLINVCLSFAVGHRNKNNVIFAAGAKSYMHLVSQWCCLYCDSSSAFNVWWHCHIRGLSTFLYFYGHIVHSGHVFNTWWRTMLILCGASIIHHSLRFCLILGTMLKFMRFMPGIWARWICSNPKGLFLNDDVSIEAWLLESWLRHMAWACTIRSSESSCSGA